VPAGRGAAGGSGGIVTTLPERPLFYSLTALSALTGIPRATLYKLTRAGRLAHTTIGVKEGSTRPSILVPREAVQRLLDELAGDTRTAPSLPDLPRVRPITPSSQRKRTKRSA
jgi:malonyl CoA-acyl carrier protein transacylase